MNFDTSILGALVPIFIVILSGYVFRKVRFPGDDFWAYAERITYFVLLPALLLQKTATANLGSVSLGTMLVVLDGSILTMACLVFLMRPWRRYGKKSFTSIFQGSIRFNTYVGFSAAFALLGDEGLMMAAVTIGMLIPFINVLCVTVLVAFNDSEIKDWRAVLSGIISNPMIISCAVGLTLNLSGIGLHKGVGDTLLLFGRASLPLGLMALGAGLSIRAARADRIVLIFNCMLKLIVLPAIMWIAAWVMNIGPVATSVAVLFAALPGAPTSYILAKQLGGDSHLMANIITAQVLVSMITLPAIMAFLI